MRRTIPSVFAFAACVVLPGSAVALEWRVVDDGIETKLGLVEPSDAQTFVGMNLRCPSGGGPVVAHIDVVDPSVAGRAATMFLTSPSADLALAGEVGSEEFEGAYPLVLEPPEAERLLALLAGGEDLRVRVASEDWVAPVDAIEEPLAEFRALCGG